MDMAAAPPRTPLRALLGLSWPIVLARATQSVIGFTDAVLTAPLGEAELAAVTTGALNSIAALLLPMGTVFILQSFTAQLRGRGEVAAAGRFARYGFVIAAIAGLVAVLAIPFVPWILGRFAYADDVHGLMSTYLCIRLLSIAPAVGTEALGNWFGGLGNTRPALVAGVVAMCANITLDLLLIEPRLGLPGYGVAGAAWASVLSSGIGFGVIYATYRKAQKDAGTAPSKLDRGEFLRVLRFGVPSGVNWFLEFAAFALFINAIVGRLGTTVLAAFNVVMQVNSISFMPAFGVASGGAILVGEAIGRKAHEDVWPIVKLTLALTGGFMGSIGILYVAAPSVLLRWFAPEGAPAPELMATAATMLAYSALWQLFDAASLTLSEALRAAGDTTWTMVARIVLAWFVFTPAAWAAMLVFSGGVPTVMVSVILYLGALSAVFAVRFASGRWRSIELLAPVAAPD